MKQMSKSSNTIKKAVFFYEKQLTDYIYTNIVYENGFQIAYNDFHLDIYNGDGKKCFSKDTTVHKVRDGYIVAENADNHLLGVIYANGKKILPEKFNNIWLTKKCIKVYINHYYGCFSYSGEEIAPLRFHDIFTYDNYIKCIDYCSKEISIIYSYSGEILEKSPLSY